MNINDYQRETAKTNKMADYIEYFMLGLGGETGELFNKFKKILRDEDGEVTRDHVEAMSLELGDIAWYWVRLVDALGLDAGDVLQQNLDKLNARFEKGTIGGSGDNR